MFLPLFLSPSCSSPSLSNSIPLIQKLIRELKKKGREIFRKKLQIRWQRSRYLTTIPQPNHPTPPLLSLNKNSEDLALGAMTNSSTNSSTISSNNINNNNNHHQHHQQQQQQHHHHHHHHHRISNGTQACAACKYQRRKCAPDCVLAPYFPHDRQKQFLNAHKLFGVSNITKIIRKLNPPDKDIAMRTIMYQSDARAKDPVGGCFRIIRDLHHQIEYCKAELDLVLQQLAICKAQQAYHHQQAQFMQPMPVGPPVDHQVQGEGDVIQANPLSDPIDYQDQYQALMRCDYDDNGDHQSQQHNDDNNNNNNNNTVQDGGGLQYSWGGGAGDQESMLASSNSSTTNNNNNHHHFVMRGSDHDQDQCGGEFQVLKQPQIMHQMNHNNVCALSYNDEVDFGSKFDDPHVDVSCSDIHTHNQLNFDSQQTTQLSEEVLLKNDEKVILEHQEDESFHYHHIPEHDLRSAATLFTLN